MVKYFLSLCFFLISFLSLGQKFNVLYPGREAIYINPYWISQEEANFSGGDYYIGLSADSFQISGSDMIYYHYNIFRKTADNLPACQFLQRYPNWIGSKTVVKNGETVFLNNEGDSLRLRVKANIDDTWKFYEFPNGDYFEAKVISKIQDDVLTAIDSLKIIELNLKGNGGNLISHNFNGKQIILTKSVGLLKAYDFSRFPKDTSVFTLMGISEPKMGVQNIKARDIYDFEIGDEFHVDHASTNIPYWGVFKKERRIILDKTISINQDTIHYKVERLTFTDNRNFQTQVSDSTLVSDTIFEKYVMSENFIIDTIPCKFNFLSQQGFPYKTQMYPSLYNYRLIKSIHEFYDPENDPCYGVLLDHYSPYEYIEGLGDYYNRDNFPDQNHKILLYYKKGSETWGTPVNFDELLLSIHNSKNKISFSLAPNPFNDFTTLKIKNDEGETYQVRVIDQYGKQVKVYSFNGEQLLIEKEGLSQGIYMIQILNDEIEKGSGKLVVY